MDTTIAREIINQLGGNHFAVMTGAKQFIAIENGVKFMIGRNASKANMVQVILRGDDTYTLQFWKKGALPNTVAILRKSKTSDEFFEMLEAAKKRAEPQMLKEYEGVYCDMLRDLFTSYTKMYTSLF